MNNIKNFDEFVNETLTDVETYGVALSIGAFLGVFLGKLVRNINNTKYKKIMYNEVLPNLKNDKVKIGENKNFIYIEIPGWEIEIDKIEKKIMFLNIKRQLDQPLYQSFDDDGNFKRLSLKAGMKFPLDLSDNDFDELIEYLNKRKTNEEADYRNVTGNGSSGNPSDQNAGPSFNKGPYSATFRQPSVVGVESDDIEDPYFAGRRDQKKSKIKKNPKTEKYRKDKAKYFDKIDKKTQDKVLD